MAVTDLEDRKVFIIVVRDFLLAISCECRRKRLADQDERDRLAKLAQEEEERRRVAAEEEAERLKQEEAAAEKEAKRFGKKKAKR